MLRMKLLLPILLTVFLVTVVQLSCSTTVIESDESEWSIARLSNLNFSLSANFYGTRRSGNLDTRGVSTLVHLTAETIPNIDMQFFIDAETGISQCKYRVYEYDELVYFEQAQGNAEEYDSTAASTDCAMQSETSKQVCTVQLEPCKSVGDDSTDTVDENTTCVTKMMTAKGTFNEPMGHNPVCVYEFHRMAELAAEYELLRYCAKAYFYRGRDYDDPMNKALREDWVLYLMQGNLYCNLTTQVEQNLDLLQLGYSVHMAQFNAGETYCMLGAELSEYTAQDKDGAFMMAAIVGSARLDNVKKDFWTKSQNLGPRRPECQRQYWESMRDQRGQYPFYLYIEHFCSMSRENVLLRFDLSIDPAKAHRRIMENMGVTILLDEGEMYFNEKHFIVGEVRADVNPN